MSRQKGSIGISNNIEVRASAPLDARYICETLADMTNPNSWEYTYIGMPIYCRESQKVYTLRYPDPTNIDNWATVGTGTDGKNGLDCAIDSITKQGRENIVTFVWHNPDGADFSADMIVLDGAVGEIGPVGPQGEKGDDGRSFTISAMYDSEEALREAHPTGEEGDAYLVGNGTDTPDFWFWDTSTNDWHNAGALAGAKGDKGDKGDQGETPEIVVAENGPDVYKLRITIGETSFVTPNLRGKDGEGAPDEDFSPTSRNSVENRTITARFEEVQNKQLSSPITIGETTATTVEDALSALNEKAVDVDMSIDGTSNNPIANSAVASGFDNKQDKTLSSPITIDGSQQTTVEGALSALSTKSVDVDSALSDSSTNPVMNKVTKAGLDGKVDKTSVGSANGIAQLDTNGKIPASQLPGGLDDVEYYDHKTDFPVTGVNDMIYVDKTANKSYRWTGSDYIEMASGGVALGETSSTAYRGDRGKTAYDDSQVNKTHIGDLSQLETTDKSDLVSAVNEVKTEVGNKVDKVTGKGLSTNDYDNTEKAEVAKVKDKQNKNLSTPVTVGNEQKSTVETAIAALAELGTYNAGSKLNAIAIADIFNAEEEYKIDDYVIYDTKLYKAVAQHSGAWDNADFEEKQVMSEIIAAAVSDYDSLQNKPQIAGITLSGNKTYSQLGIQQSEQGKGLSTNDYDNTAKAIVDGITSALSDKVDKITGKGLSTNDYNNDEKTKVTNATTHLSKVVTGEDGVHGLKVTPVTEDEDKIYYKNGNNWKEIQLGSVTQLEEMPTPVAKYSGKIYQYVGVTNDNYKKGYFYECINAAGVYTWQAIRVQSGGGQTIQYDPLPTAEATLVGSLLQYVGTTNANYKRGHFYECVSGETTGTFIWREVVVDTLTFSDANITSIKEAFDNGLD